MADANRAIELEPKLAVAYADRGLAYSALGEPELAAKDWQMALSLTDDHDLKAQIEALNTQRLPIPPP